MLRIAVHTLNRSLKKSETENMSLQNRVEPFGNIIVTSARGSFLGNRGVIHNASRQIVRPYKHKAWIICQLEFKGRHREVMTPDRWTELFFLDEATALAAGHRPCFECRKEDAKRFKECWIKGNPEYGFTMKTSIKEIDEVMHRERMSADNKKVFHQRKSSEIPNGAFVEIDNEPYLMRNGALHHWTPFGYDPTIDLKTSVLSVINPKSTVNTLLAGYQVRVSGF